MPLCVKGFRRSCLRLVRCPPAAGALPALLDPWPSSLPSVAVVLPHLQVVRPRFAAGAPSGPAASPAAGWQRPGNGQPCPRALAGAGAGLGAAVVWWWRGLGVACPKSRCLGCEPATLATESFPCCPPGPLARAAARRARASRRVKTRSRWFAEVTLKLIKPQGASCTPKVAVSGRPVSPADGRRCLGTGAVPQLGGGDGADREGGHDQHDVPQDRGAEPGPGTGPGRSSLFRSPRRRSQPAH
jgi:hypothetical protein